MFWGFHGLLLLLPLFLLGKFFWIVILALLIWALVRRGTENFTCSFPMMIEPDARIRYNL